MNQPDSVTLYLRNMPADLVREAKVKAAREGTTLTAVVIDALSRSLEGGGWVAEPGEDELRQDRAWYEENRARLVERYRGAYVAIVDGEVLDHDRDFEALAERVFGRLGSRPILMPRVGEAEQEVHVRSPRTRAG